MNTDTKKYVTLGVFFAVFVILIVLLFTGGIEKTKKLPLPSIPEPDTSFEEIPEPKKITLYFPSEVDGLLHGEEREILSTSSLIFEIKQTIEELLIGSENGYISPFPPGSKLREVFMIEDGIVYVDFSKEIQDEHLSGTTAEISTVYSVVNSLAFNFKSVKKIFILVDGNEKETLKGHIDISRPLVPMYNLNSK
ncbi:GerMN domain-containing protein [Acidobacteriota bacterium]